MPTTEQQIRPAYLAGANSALYEERRFSGYQPHRFVAAGERLDYAQGYLSISPNCAQAQADVRQLKARCDLVVDRPLNYEEDGNVLFHGPRR